MFGIHCRPSRGSSYGLLNGQGHLPHGVTVEIGPEEFFEGCFAGEWGENLTEVGNVFGSGMRMQGDETMPECSLKLRNAEQ